jgi:hypothetical protein
MTSDRWSIANETSGYGQVRDVLERCADHGPGLHVGLRAARRCPWSKLRQSVEVSPGFCFHASAGWHLAAAGEGSAPRGEEGSGRLGRLPESVVPAVASCMTQLAQSLVPPRAGVAPRATFPVSQSSQDRLVLTHGAGRARPRGAQHRPRLR